MQKKPAKRQPVVAQSKKQFGKEIQDTRTAGKEKSRRRNTIITAVSIFMVILLVISIAYYMIYVMPFQRVIIKVEDDVVKIDYFLKRALNGPSSEDPIWSTLQSLTYELIVTQEAPNYGINITDQDIDTTLRDVAEGNSESITDAEFKEWYRQLLNTTQFSDKLYRDWVKRSLEQRAMAQLLADNTPTVAEQGYFWIIIVKTYEEALSVKERADNGEEFQNLAREASLDTSTAEKGGEVGWLPFGVLEARFEYLVTDLEIGKCSDPVINNTGEDTEEDTQDYALFMISERDAVRELLPEHLDYLKVNAYQDWLNAQMSVKKIEFHGIHSGAFDDTTHAWLTYQLERLREGISGSSSE